MLKIRLQRIGRKNDPSFRIVVTDSRKGPKSGKYLELLGLYDPVRSTVSVKNERIRHWISNGAQVSGTVHNILIQEGVTEGKKINVLPKKSPIKKEEEVKEESTSETAKSETSEEVVEKDIPSDDKKEKEEIKEKIKEPVSEETVTKETPQDDTVAADATNKPEKEESTEEKQKESTVEKGKEEKEQTQ